MPEMWVQADAGYREPEGGWSRGASPPCMRSLREAVFDMGAHHSRPVRKKNTTYSVSSVFCPNKVENRFSHVTLNAGT